jgi:hypothetical protein
MYQYHKLTATFENTLHRATIDEAIRQETEESPRCDARKCAVSELIDGRYEITGPAQGVMFLIGRIAGFGEDGLISVKPA